jgi:hypothetical protein
MPHMPGFNGESAEMPVKKDRTKAGHLLKIPHPADIIIF